MDRTHLRLIFRMSARLLHTLDILEEPDQVLVGRSLVETSNQHHSFVDRRETIHHCCSSW